MTIKFAPSIVPPRAPFQSSADSCQASKEVVVNFGVVIPVFNESRLALLLPRFDFTSPCQVVVINDGSDDGATAVTAQFPVTVLKHDRRLGVGAAIRTGLLYLRAHDVQVALVMAGNNKDDPADIPAILAQIRAGADYVQGSRFITAENAKATPLVRRIITRGVAWLWSIRFFRKLTDVTNGFRGYKLSLLDDPNIDVSQAWLDRYELEYYLHYKVLSLGYEYAEVPVAKCYPTDGLPTSNIRLRRDFWSLMRPLLLLTLRAKK